MGEAHPHLTHGWLLLQEPLAGNRKRALAGRPHVPVAILTLALRILFEQAFSRQHMNKGWNLYRKESMKHSVLQDLQREEQTRRRKAAHTW